MRRAELHVLAAMAHVIPGFRLRVTTQRGAVVVDRTAAADLDGCGFRTAVLEARRDDGVTVADVVDHVEVDGAVEDLGLGLYLTAGASAPWVVWTASALGVDALCNAIASVAVADELDVRIRVRPDRALGVCVLRIEVGAPAPSSAVEIGRSVGRSCLLAELEHHLSTAEVP